MDLRSTKPGINAADAFMAELPAGIIGYTKRNGLPIPATIGGGAPDDSDDDTDPTPPEDTDADDDDDSDDDDGAEDDDDKSSKGKSKSKSKKDDDDDEETVPKWKADKLDRRMRAADKRATDLQRELDELKAKMADNKDVTPELRDELATAKATADKATKTNHQLTLQVAFLTTNIPGIEWQDPEAALRLVDLDDVDIEDGKVDRRALRAALKDLARRKPYLVKKAEADDDNSDDEDTSGVRSPRKASGPAMNGNRKGKNKGELDRAALAKRFPVLGRQ